VSAGTLLIGNANSTSLTSFGNGTVSFDSGTFTVATLSMGLKTGASSGAATATLNVGGGNFNVNTAFTLGSQATAGTASAILKVTGGTFTSNVDILSGTASATSTITLDGGTLDLTGHNIGSASIAVDNLNLGSGTLQNLLEFNGGAAITKSLSVTDPTNNLLILTGTNAFTGALTLASNGGVVSVQSNTGLGSTAGGTTVSAGTTLQLSNNITVGAEALALNGAGYTTTSQLGALVNLSGTNTYGGLISAVTNSTIAAAPSSTLNLTGGVVKSGTTVTFSGGGNINVNSAITGAAANSDVIITGSGTAVTYNGANTYNGPTTVQTGANLIFGSTGSTSGGPITVASTARLAGATGSSIGNSGGNAVVVSAGATITGGTGLTGNPGLLASTGGTAPATANPADLGANSATQVWTGAAGTGGGTYAWKINTQNSGAPNTGVPNTTLTADPTAVGGNWDVMSMTTLNVISSSGRFNIQILPVAVGGAGPGFADASNYVWQVADVNSGNIYVNSVNIANASISNPVNGQTTPLAALQSAFTLDISALGALNGGNNNVFNSNVSIGMLPDGAGGEDIVVNYVAAPEPTSFALLGLGLGGLAMRRRRRRVVQPVIE
jgi:hypothetical protein